MKKTKFSFLTLAILFSTHISCMELVTTETKQESPLLALSPELYINIINPSDIPTISSLKRTCKQLNDDTHYHQTSRKIITSAHIDICTAGLLYFAQTHAQNIHNNTLDNNPMLEANFKHLLLNNPDERKEALTILGWSIEQINTLQKMINAYTTLSKNINKHNFKTIINNKTAIRILASIDPSITSGPLLNWACYQQKTKAVISLLSTPGIDVNKANNTICITPLHAACERGNKEIVQLLLNAPDINIHKTNYDGETAFDIARKRNDTEIVQLLTDHQSTHSQK